MTRKECLEHAMGCVLRDRQKQYGEPEDCFETIAMMWSAYLGKIIQGWDVAAMMALLKIARIKANPAHADNWCDLAGYAACGAECRQKFEAEMKKTVEDAFETFPHLKPKAEGVEDSKFKAGDKVQIRVTLPSVSDHLWVDGTYARYDRGCAFPHAVYNDAGLEENVKEEDIRPAPGAEGCEELAQEQYDAPQTKEELLERIRDVNPATFKPRTPTGEELAEMAEEESHG